MRAWWIFGLAVVALVGGVTAVASGALQGIALLLLGLGLAVWGLKVRRGPEVTERRAAELRARLQAGEALVRPVGRRHAAAAVLFALGLALILGGDAVDAVLPAIGVVLAGLAVAAEVLFACGFLQGTRTRLAREGIVVEDADRRYVFAWDQISKLGRKGPWVVQELLISVRDPRVVVASLRRLRRGSLERARERLRKSLAWNERLLECHLVLSPFALGIDVDALHAVISGYLADPASRQALRPEPVPEDMS